MALEDGRLLAISSEDGSDLWSKQLSFAPRFAPPTVAGDRLYVPLREGRLQALDTRTGSVQRDVDLRSACSVSPIVSDGIVYACSAIGLYAANNPVSGPILGLDARNGTLLWRHRVEAGYPLVPPVFDGEYLAVAAADRVRILDRRTGEQTYWYPFPRTSRPADVSIADGTVYAVLPRLMVAIGVDSRRPWYEGIRRAWTLFYV